ncbi:MAG: hypothetical protein AAFW68_07885 [Pseudomonadota bacterium]
MVRSLIAIIIAVIAGFATAKTVEGGGAALAGASAGSIQYAAFLAGGWFAGAFVAAFLALFIGVRWAPLGMVAASSIFLGAFITLISNPLPWFLWPGAVLASALGGYGAVKILDAKHDYPFAQKKTGLFDD